MKNYIILVLIAAVVSLWFFRCEPEGTVRVRKTWLDSLQAVALKPADTVRVYIDTVKEPPVKIVKVPVPYEVKGDIALYSDTLKNEKLMVVVNDSVQGRILYRNMQYELYVPVRITKEIHLVKPVPFPYEVVKERTFKYYGEFQYGTDGWRAGAGKIYTKWDYTVGVGLYGGRDVGNHVGVTAKILW